MAEVIKTLRGQCFCESCFTIFEWDPADRHTVMGNEVVKCPECGFDNILTEKDYALTLKMDASSSDTTQVIDQSPQQ